MWKYESVGKDAHSCRHVEVMPGNSGRVPIRHYRNNQDDLPKKQSKETRVLGFSIDTYIFYLEDVGSRSMEIMERVSIKDIVLAKGPIVSESGTLLVDS